MVLLKLLRHPFIVGYRDFWQEQLHVFIVMEYCEGGDLGALIGLGKHFKEVQIIRWLAEVLLALTHMHSQNVLHRDIKPQNMFLNRWKDIKLGDFGLSTVRKDKKKQHQTAVGTLGYAAPELLEGKAYDEKCDIYALGCSLYEITTLRSPFEDIKAGIFPVPLPDIYTEDLTKMLNEMLMKAPNKRPGAGELLQNPIIQNEMPYIERQADIYAEFQQRDDEIYGLRRKVLLLERELIKYKPESADSLSISDEALWVTAAGSLHGSGGEKDGGEGSSNSSSFLGMSGPGFRLKHKSKVEHNSKAKEEEKKGD